MSPVEGLEISFDSLLETEAVFSIVAVTFLLVIWFVSSTGFVGFVYSNGYIIGRKIGFLDFRLIPT